MVALRCLASPRWTLATLLERPSIRIATRTWPWGGALSSKAAVISRVWGTLAGGKSAATCAPGQPRPATSQAGIGGRGEPFTTPFRSGRPGRTSCSDISASEVAAPGSRVLLKGSAPRVAIRVIIPTAVTANNTMARRCRAPRLSKVSNRSNREALHTPTTTAGNASAATGSPPQRYPSNAANPVAATISNASRGPPLRGVARPRPQQGERRHITVVTAAAPPLITAHVVAARNSDVPTKAASPITVAITALLLPRRWRAKLPGNVVCLLRSQKTAKAPAMGTTGWEGTSEARPKPTLVATLSAARLQSSRGGGVGVLDPSNFTPPAHNHRRHCP